MFAGLGLAIASFCAAAPQDAAAPPMASGDSIMVLPFTTAPGSKSAWMGKAIQQSLFTDLVQRSRAHAIAPQGEPPANQNDALRAARDAKVSMVVFGDVQESGTDVRITGQILDVATGNVLGALKATGPEASLFSLEDATSMQVLHVLPAALLPPMQQQPAPMQQPAPVQQQPAVTQQAQQPQTQPPPNYDYYSQPVTYSPPPDQYATYNYYGGGDGYGYGYGSYYGPYGYGYGGYGYPYWGYPYFGIGASFVFTNGHDHHDDHHDGNHNHNDGSHGNSNSWNGSHNTAAGHSTTAHSGTSAAFAHSGGAQNFSSRSGFTSPSSFGSHNASLARMGSSMGHMSSFGSFGHAGGGSMGHMGGGAMGHAGGGGHR
jgi:TolB-like protein